MIRKFSRSEIEYITQMFIEFFEREQAERMMNASGPVIEKCSVRLRTILESHGLHDWTARDIAHFRANEWKRLRGMGKKCFAELEKIVTKAGYEFGTGFFKRDDKWNFLIEKPKFNSL